MRFDCNLVAKGRLIIQTHPMHAPVEVIGVSIACHRGRLGLRDLVVLVAVINISRMRPHQAKPVFLGARIPKSPGYTFTFAPLPHFKHTTPRGLRRLALQGRCAKTVLNRVSANSVSVPLRGKVHTQRLTHQCGIVSDLTITRTGPQEYLLVTGDVLQSTGTAWLRGQTRADAVYAVIDVTSADTILPLQGPRSREILQALSRADRSTEAVPFRQSCMLEIGPVPVRAVSVTYMGKLGYEPYSPTEFPPAAHDALIGAIRAAGAEPVHCGLGALESLRLEKDYRDFGGDIDNTDTPLKVGFVVDLGKPDFIGKAALLAQKAAGPLPRPLVQVLLQDPEPLLFDNEPILCDGGDVGYIRAGAFGLTLGASVGFWMVKLAGGATPDRPCAQHFEIEVNDHRIAATPSLDPAPPSLDPMYDPKSERVRA